MPSIPMYIGIIYISGTNIKSCLNKDVEDAILGLLTAWKNEVPVIETPRKIEAYILFLRAGATISKSFGSAFSFKNILEI